MKHSAKAAFDAVNSPIVNAAVNSGFAAYLSHVCFKAGVPDLGSAFAIVAAASVALLSSRVIDAWNNRPSNKITTLDLSR
jgi:hypothetical protein